MIATFVPIICVWAFILCLRSRAIQEVVEQRRLDRCLYGALHHRCHALSILSKSNHVLKVAQKGQFPMILVSIFLPELGTVLKKAGGSALKAIVLYQQGEIVKETLTYAASLRCGAPIGALGDRLEFSRDDSALSEGSEIPNPLEWENADHKGGIALRSWNFKKESFGFCRAKTGETGELDGEEYQVDFHKPPAKSLWKRLFSWLPSP